MNKVILPECEDVISREHLESPGLEPPRDSRVAAAVPGKQKYTHTHTCTESTHALVYAQKKNEYLPPLPCIMRQTLSLNCVACVLSSEENGGARTAQSRQGISVGWTPITCFEPSFLTLETPTPHMTAARRSSRALR